MKKRVFLLLAATAGLAALTACGPAPTPAPPSKEPAEAPKQAPQPEGPVDAQTAFYEMYKPARTWAPDLQPLSLIAGEIPGMENSGGKAGMWTAVFVSPARHEARTFVYAVADHGSDIHKGVTAGGAESWTGATPKSRPFQIADFTVNSDAAYKTAAAKAAAWLKGHPGKKVALSLVNAARFPSPVWYVMWGNAKAGYLVFVNAANGQIMTGK
jgi:hypothetical protein